MNLLKITYSGFLAPAFEAPAAGLGFGGISYHENLSETNT